MRRFFRCSLRQLLLLILAVSVLLAVIAPRWWKAAREEHLAAATEQLLAAADKGDLAAARAAIAAGADLTIWDERRGTPLCCAIRDGNLQLVELLLAAGTSPNQHGLAEQGTALEFA